MQVELLQIAAVKSVLQNAEAEIFKQTNSKVRLLIAPEIVSISFTYVASVIRQTYGISLNQLTGNSRLRNIVDARRAVALILKDYSHLTLKEIAKYLKMRDHTSIMNLITTARSFIKYQDENFYPKYKSTITIIDSQILLNKLQ
ncbi:helix-turn-helix domain-containing protein [Arachidicoccus soli]|uniref:Chromosomal replication initiator DnaA C-terminal domain-containing protein n=1 Tax=Arachidicoccus soli TaxID=2341117 RepID=A0A386HRY4_9BACT|nr:helix-turn-helix domain-containing protein [Arachidicoccus soli]AYD48230.1 hypothetical protein D6B99_11840 [Arachidicoccus soli]